MPAGNSRRRRKRRIIGALSAAAMGAIVVLTTVVNYWPGGATITGGGAAAQIRLSLVATRDLGALPDRNSWCTAGRTAEHCWLLQQASGDATDTGSAANWHLTPAGSPRVGVPAGIPVANGAVVDITSELATWGTGGTSTVLAKAGVTHGATNLVSISAVFRRVDSAATNPVIISHRDTGSPFKGYYVYYNKSTNTLRGGVDTGPTTCSATSSIDPGDAWACATVVLDARTASAAKIYINGTDRTSATKNLVSCIAGWDISSSVKLHGWTVSGTYAGSHGIARVRVDDGVALSQAQHQAICGDYAQPPAGGPSDNKPLLADDTWTQTGGDVCYPTGDSSAVCQPGGVPHYAADATGLGWVTEPDATNRVLYNTAIDCTNWTCNGPPTIGATVAPDGSMTATEVTIQTLGATDIRTATTGYTGNAPLDFRVWMKCSSGDVRIRNGRGSSLGDWRISCSTLGGSWSLIKSGHAALTQANDWTATVGGQADPIFLSLDANPVTVSIWAPTLTEESGTGLSVIPTAAAAVSTGDPVWLIDNDPDVYWRSGDTITQTITEISGTCLTTSATQIYMSGAVGSECAGIWYGLEVRR